MKQNTYLQALLSCFSSMDLDKLRLILKNKYSYQNTTKEIFLKEIEAIFTTHKNAGDTKLLVNNGECGSKSCPNCGTKGYRFIGNHSKNYVDLIFEAEGDDIKDIRNCSTFKTEITVNDLGNKAFIFINLDDEVNFNKSPEYLNKVNSATSAVAEIISNPPQQLNFEKLSSWLDRHAVTNAVIGDYHTYDPEMKWTPFLILYKDLTEIKDYIDACINKILQANKAIPPVSEEQNLIDWLLNYEETYEQSSFIMMFDLSQENDYYIFSTPDYPQLKGEEFSQSMNFINFYQNNNWDLLNKYSTYTMDEEIEISNNQDFQKMQLDLFSLRFHLQNRKSLEKLGVNIPFYLER